MDQNALPKQTEGGQEAPSVKKTSSFFSPPFVIGALLVILLATLGGWYALVSTQQTLPQQKRINQVRIGIKSAPLGFYGQEDVEYENPTFNFNANIFEGLTTFNKDLKFADRQLVESWTTPKDTTWRLKLRQGVRFHNGDEFTAEDAKFSIDFGKKYVVQDDLAAVKQVTVLDAYTIEIETNGPSPLLLNNLLNVYVVSKKHIEANGGIKTKKTSDGAEIYYLDYQEPIGTGPYKFVRQDGNQYYLTANESYYLGKPPIASAIYRVIEDNNERVDALLNGTVDLIEDIPATRIADIEKTTNYAFKSAPSLRVIYLAFDTASSKLKYSSAPTNPFKKPQVRLAFYKAINEEEIVQAVMGGHAYKASQPATQVNFGFNEAIKRPFYNREEAKKLLEEAGYPNGFDIVLDVPNNRYHNDEAIGKKVVEDLNKAGIRAKLNAMPKDAYFEKILDNYDTSFYLLGWSQDNGDAGGAYGTLLHTPKTASGYGSFNIGKYSSKKVDQLIEEADKTVDSVKRQTILKELAQAVMEDVPIIPLHQQEDSFAIDRTFRWTPRRDNGVRAFEISFE